MQSSIPENALAEMAATLLNFSNTGIAPNDWSEMNGLYILAFTPRQAISVPLKEQMLNTKGRPIRQVFAIVGSLTPQNRREMPIHNAASMFFDLEEDQSLFAPLAGAELTRTTWDISTPPFALQQGRWGQPFPSSVIAMLVSWRPIRGLSADADNDPFPRAIR